MAPEPRREYGCSLQRYARTAPTRPGELRTTARTLPRARGRSWRASARKGLQLRTRFSWWEDEPLQREALAIRAALLRAEAASLCRRSRWEARRGRWLLQQHVLRGTVTKLAPTLRKHARSRVRLTVVR